MFATIPKDLLAKLQAAPRGIVHTGAKLPILGCVRLTVPQDNPFQLRIEATDLDHYLIRAVTLTEPAVHGSVAVPYAEFSRIRPTGATVHLHLADGKAVFTDSAGPSFRLDTHPVNEFPAEPPIPTGGPATTLCAPFFAAILNALPFASTDETRYALNGMYVTPTIAVATDGRRLLAIHTSGPPISCIIPTKAAKAMAGLFSGDTFAAFSADHAFLSLTGPGTILYARLIPGSYPNWQQVFPSESEFHQRLTFADPEAVEAFVSRLNKGRDCHAVSIAYASTYSVRLTHPKGAMTTAAAISAPFEEIAFNPAFLAAALKAAGPTLHLIDPSYPAILRSPTATAILMPMRIYKPAPEPEPETEPVAEVV